MVPMRWYIFVQWLTLNDEVGKTFEQRLRFIENPGFLNNVSEFTVETGSYLQRVISFLPAFPLLEHGIYDLFLDIRAKGTEEWISVANYPLRVDRT